MMVTYTLAKFKKFKFWRAKTRYFMESDSPEWHSESEFYYPEDIDESVNTENINKQEQVTKKTDKQQQFLAKVHDFIEEQMTWKHQEKNSVWHKCLETLLNIEILKKLP